MNKYLLSLILFLTLLTTGVFATETSSDVKYNERGNIIIETINSLEKNGYITNKNAMDAKKEMVFNIESMILYEAAIDNSIDKNNDVINANISFSEYFSFLNIIKILGIIMILIGFKGFIFRFIVNLKNIPPVLYLGTILLGSIYLTFFPETISVQQSFYISLGCVLLNLITFAGLCIIYANVVINILSKFSFNIRAEVIIPFYLTLYFVFFTISLESQFLGLLTLISFVAMFGFVIGFNGLLTYLGYEKEDYVNQSLLVNGLIVIIYSLLKINNIPVPYIELFSFGIEYICTIVLGVTLFIYSSFYFVDDSKFKLYALLMIITEACCLTAMYLFNLEVIPVIINTAFFLSMISWIGFLTNKINGILTAFVLGGSLYGVALFMESRPELFINSLF